MKYQLGINAKSILALLLAITLVLGLVPAFGLGSVSAETNSVAANTNSAALAATPATATNSDADDDFDPFTDLYIVVVGSLRHVTYNGNEHVVTGFTVEARPRYGVDVDANVIESFLENIRVEADVPTIRATSVLRDADTGAVLPRVARIPIDSIQIYYTETSDYEDDDNDDDNVVELDVTYRFVDRIQSTPIILRINPRQIQAAAIGRSLGAFDPLVHLELKVIGNEIDLDYNGKIREHGSFTVDAILLDGAPTPPPGAVNAFLESIRVEVDNSYTIRETNVSRNTVTGAVLPIISEFPDTAVRIYSVENDELLTNFSGPIETYPFVMRIRPIGIQVTVFAMDIAFGEQALKENIRYQFNQNRFVYIEGYRDDLSDILANGGIVRRLFPDTTTLAPIHHPNYVQVDLGNWVSFSRVPNRNYDFTAAYGTLRIGSDPATLRIEKYANNVPNAPYDFFRVGEYITYTIRVTNTSHHEGGTPAKNVVITELHPGTWATTASLRHVSNNSILHNLSVDEDDFEICDYDGLRVIIPELEHGYIFEIEFTILATRNMVPDNNIVGYLHNRVEVSADDVDYDPYDHHSEDTVQIRPLSPVLAINKTAVNNPVFVGDDIVYTITVQNTVNAELGRAANNVLISESQPGEWAATALLNGNVVTAPENFTISNLNVTIPVLAPGATFVIEFTADSNYITERIHENIVFVSAPGDPEIGDDDPIPDDEDVEVLPRPNLNITKEADSNEVVVGDDIVYTITVTNRNTNIERTVGEARNVVIRETQTGTWGTAQLNGNIVTEGFTTSTYTVHIPVLNPGDVFEIIFTVVATEQMISPNGHRNVVVVRNNVNDSGNGDDCWLICTDYDEDDCDCEDNNGCECDDGHCDSDDDTVIITRPPVNQPNPILTITKAADTANRVYVGDEIVYTITVRNTGTVPVTHVLITESLPGTWRNARLNGISVAAPGSFTINGSVVTLPSLAAGGVFEIEFVVTATAEMVRENGAPFRNTVVVSAPYDPYVPDDDDYEDIPILPLPDLRIIKRGPGHNVQVGQNIVYRIIVINTTTNAAANNVVVTETQRGTWGSAWLNGSAAPADFFTTSTYNVYIPVLNPGDRFEIDFSVLATNAMVGQHGNVVIVTSDDTDDHYDDEVVTVVRPGGPGGPWNPGPGGPGGPGDPGNPSVSPDVELDDPIIPLVPFTTTHYRYLIGDDRGLIRPRDSITRAEVATIFFRLITDEFRVEMWTQTNPFSDVVLTNWFNNGVSTMANTDVVRGMPDGTFQPNRSITRAEFAAMISRFVGNSYYGPNLFPDIYGHWAQNDINLIGSLGWANGMPNGAFEPNRPITRAEAATIVNRILIRHPEHLSDLLPNRTVWPDMTNSSAWYYIDLQEATNSHSYDVKDAGFHETWLELIPCPNWVALERPHSTPMAHRS